MQSSLENVAGWLGDITSFEVSVAESRDGYLQATLGDSCPVTLEEDGANLVVACVRELSPPLQNVMEPTQLQAAAEAQARAGAFPAFSSVDANEAGNQSVAFRVLVHLNGLTRNELTGALWQVWKAHEILEQQIAAFRELEVFSAELDETGVEEEFPAEESSEAVSGSAPSPAGRFCQKCGKQAGPGQSFCNGCGAPFGG